MKPLLWAAALLFLASQALADPANIGNYIGSNRSWNNFEFSEIKTTMTNAGHTVEADGAMSAANLANDDVFIIGEAAGTPGAGALSDLSTWVNNGGILLVFTDSNGTGASGGNEIMNGIGSSIDFTSAFITRAGPLGGGNFATTGPPYNIVGNNMDASPGNTVTGGTALINGGIHYESIGAGWVFGFGDRYDHNFANLTNTDTNGQFFLNTVMGGSVPEPASLALLGVGAALLVVRRKRRATA